MGDVTPKISIQSFILIRSDIYTHFDCSLTPALNDIVDLVKHLVELQSLDDVVILGVVVAIVIHQSNLTIPMDNQHLDDWLRPIKSTSYIAKADNYRRSRHIKEHDLLIIEREHVYEDGDLPVLVEGNAYHCRELILSTHEFIDENEKRTKITEKLIIEGVIIASVRILKCNRIL